MASFGNVSSVAGLGVGNGGVVAAHGVTHQRGGSDEVFRYAGEHSASSVVENVPRWCCSTSAANVSGQVNIAYFTAPDDLTILRLAACTGGAGASGVTLAKLGLYSANAVGDITFMESTANDTTLFGSVQTMYAKALQSSQRLVRGQRYAIAVLIIGSGAGQLRGPSLVIGFNNPTPVPALPILSAILTGQTDLPTGTTLFTSLSVGPAVTWVAASTT